MRRRPLMYIGEIGSRGLNRLLLEMVINSLSEASSGYGNSVRVTLRADGSAEVSDEGRTPANAERAFTDAGYGVHGYVLDRTERADFSYPVANALSERLTVVARGDGSVYRHVFRAGATHAVAQSGGPPGDRGLTISFRPDPEIFGGATFDRGEIRERLEQLAYLHSGVRITFTDEASGTRDEYEFADGIAAYVRWLNAERRPLHADVIIIRGEEQGVRYEVGLQCCGNKDESRVSFANDYGTRLGGTHDNGVRAGAAAAIREFAREFQSKASQLLSEDTRAGLTAVASVWLTAPMFCGPTRMQLSNPEAEAVVRTVVQRGVREYFEANREAARRVVDAATEARAVRVAAKAARKQQRQSKRGE